LDDGGVLWGSNGVYRKLFRGAPFQFYPGS
jgi:hypothetical protein